MRNFIYILGLIGTAILIFTAQTTFLSWLPLNFSIVSIALVTLLSSRLNAWRWAFIVAVLSETVSPYPLVTTFASTLLAFAVARYINQTYISHRAMLGSIVLCAVTQLTFEFTIFVSARLAHAFSAGWVQAFNRGFFTFLILRIILSTAVCAALLMLFRRILVRARGTVIQFG